MRVIPLSLVLPLVLVSAGCGDSNEGAGSPEDAARVVVEALKQNDFSLCEPMVMNGEDLQALVRALRDEDDPKARRLVQRFERLGPDKMLEKVRGHVRKTFDALRKELDEEGFPWADVQFDRLHDIQRTKVRGIEALRFYIRLHVGDKPGEIKMESLMRFPRGWVITDGLKS